MSKYFIDRNKAVNALNEAQIEGTDTYKGLGLAKQIIDNLPCECRPKGEWKEFPDEGFVECPFCDHATNCEDNIDELHFCFFCGAELKKGGAEFDPSDISTWTIENLRKIGKLGFKEAFKGVNFHEGKKGGEEV